MTAIHSIEDTLFTALAAFLTELPRLVGALLILIIGWIIAGLVAKFVQKLLDKVGADRITQRAGIDTFMDRAGVKNATAGAIVGWVAKWYIRILVLEAAIGALGIQSVSNTFDKFASYLPNVAVAVVIVCLGAFLARIAADAVRGFASGAGFGNASMLGTLTSAVILALTFVAALQQIHVAETLVNELLVAVLFAAALAAGLAFGLGGREVAANLLGSAYDKGQKATDKVQQGGSRPTGVSDAQTGPRAVGQPAPGAIGPRT